ncbi:hypothetical protein HELRODRAFT_146499, partial [Helobdella robusta]|uniref:Nuclear receptor domain-containing protein n=1 Tax=Helobdella robusta TaxID=6412 RepID=T1EJS6_HELRO
CKVCGDFASGNYFGALVCIPCKTFYLRYSHGRFTFECKGNQNCEITVTTRIQCKYCRFMKCKAVGM